MDSTELAGREHDNDVADATTSLLVLVELPAFGLEHRICFDVKSRCQKRVMDNVQELVQQLRDSLPDTIIPRENCSAKSELMALRRQATRQFDELHEDKKQINHWKSKSRHDENEVRKMRDTYLKDLLQLREQLFQRNKATFDKTDWKPCCATVFDPCVYTTNEEATQILSQKRTMMQQEFELRLWEIQQQYRVRLRVLHEQLLTSAVHLQYKCKLCSKLMEALGYEDEHQVQKELGKVAVSVPQISRRLDKRLHAAEHICRDGPRQVPELAKPNARRMSVPNPARRMSVPTPAAAQVSSDMVASREDEPQSPTTIQRRRSAPADVIHSSSSGVQDVVKRKNSDPFDASGVKQSFSKPSGDLRSCADCRVASIGTADGTEGGDDGESTSDNSSLCESSSDSEWEGADYLPVSPALGCDTLTPQQLQRVIANTRKKLSCDWKSTVMTMAKLTSGATGCAAVQAGCNPRLKLDSFTPLDEEACVSFEAAKNDAEVQAAPIMAEMAIQCANASESSDYGNTAEKKLEQLLEQAVEVKTTLAGMRVHSQDLADYEPATKLLAWIVHVTTDPGEQKKTFSELCKDTLMHIRGQVASVPSEHSLHSSDSFRSDRLLEDLEDLRMKEAEPSPEPAPAELPGSGCRLSFKNNGKPHFSRNGRLPPRKLLDASGGKAPKRSVNQHRTLDAEPKRAATPQAELLQPKPSKSSNAEIFRFATAPGATLGGQCQCQGPCECGYTDISHGVLAQGLQNTMPISLPTGAMTPRNLRERANLDMSARSPREQRAPGEAAHYQRLSAQAHGFKYAHPDDVPAAAVEETFQEPKSPSGGSKGPNARPWSGAPGRNLKTYQKHDFYSAPAWMHAGDSREQTPRDSNNHKHSVEQTQQEPITGNDSSKPASARGTRAVDRFMRPASAFGRASRHRTPDERVSDPSHEIRREEDYTGVPARAKDDAPVSSRPQSRSGGAKPTARPVPSLSLNRAAIANKRKLSSQNSGISSGKPGPSDL